MSTTRKNTGRKTPLHFNYEAHRFYRKVASHLKSMLGKQLPRHIVIACSGGPDSIALVDMMHRFACEHAVIPVVVHVNHHLRGKESQRDAKFVREFCQKRDLPVVVLDAKLSKSGNVQKMARDLRYAALTAAARITKSPVVLTAHHANDQAETVLLHMLRGSGPRVLSGIHAKRLLSQKIQLLRPLLPYTRPELEAYIENARLPYVKDRSNRSLKYTRNWIRKEVMPLLAKQNPRVVEALCQVAQQCREVK